MNRDSKWFQRIVALMTSQIHGGSINTPFNPDVLETSHILLGYLGVLLVRKDLYLYTDQISKPVWFSFIRYFHAYYETAFALRTMLRNHTKIVMSERPDFSLQIARCYNSIMINFFLSCWFKPKTYKGVMDQTSIMRYSISTKGYFCTPPSNVFNAIILYKLCTKCNNE